MTAIFSNYKAGIVLQTFLNTWFDLKFLLKIICSNNWCVKDQDLVCDTGAEHRSTELIINSHNLLNWIIKCPEALTITFQVPGLISKGEKVGKI